MKRLLPLMMLLLALTSCSSERMALSQMRHLTTRIEARGDRYDLDDWKAAYDDYKAIDAKMDVKKLKPEQAKEYGELKGRCISKFAKSSVESIVNSIGSYLNEGFGALKGIIDGLSEEE